MRALFFPWGVLLQLIALVHFVRRRPESYWLWVIIFFGPLGAIVYLFAEMVPDLNLMSGSVKGFSRRRQISRLRAIVLENPSAGNYEELGDLLLEEKKYAEARDCYDRALSSRTDHIDPFYRRGIAAFEAGDAAAALPDLERTVKSDPRYDYSRARLYYARALAAVGRNDEALQVFQALVDGTGTTEALVYAAEFFTQHGRKDEARVLVERVAARKRTMPAYQKRRERPWLRRASMLKRKLTA
jgi:hypothetical protein